MKKAMRVVCVAAALMAAQSASAIADVAVAAIGHVGVPVAVAICDGLSHTPPARMFGTEEAVYGLDWGSMACKADNVYGAHRCSRRRQK